MSSLGSLQSSSSSSSASCLVISESFLATILENPFSPLGSAAIAITLALGRAYQHNKVMNIKSFSQGVEDWNEDTDTRERRCEINLAHRPLMTSLVQHQAIVFDFGDRAVTYEANEDRGLLKPYCNFGRPTGDDWTMKEIAVRRMSPAEINQLAKCNVFNLQEYSLTLVNCQIWIAELCKQLSVPLQSLAQNLEQRFAKFFDEGIDSQWLNETLPAVAGCMNFIYDVYLSLRMRDMNDGTLIYDKLSHACNSNEEMLDYLVKNLPTLFKDPVIFWAKLAKTSQIA